MAHPRVVHWYGFWESMGDGDIPDNLDDDEFVIHD